MTKADTTKVCSSAREGHSVTREEWFTKLSRIDHFRKTYGAKAVVIASRAGFAWLTGGGRHHVNHAQEAGVGLLVFTAGGVSLVCSSIEAERLCREELARLPAELAADIDVRTWPWWQPSQRAEVLRAVIGQVADRPPPNSQKIPIGTGVFSDVAILGVETQVAAVQLAELRGPLHAAEQARYRHVGARLGAVVGDVAAALRPGLSELAAAGLLHERLLAAGLWPWVTLIAADDRLAHYRHPLPRSDSIIKSRVMIATCAEGDGLIAAVTRMVSFGPLDQSTIGRHSALLRVEAALWAATRAGRTLAEVFADAQAAYRAVGFADQWTAHHQGGPCGYQPREAIATAEAAQYRIMPGTALAWNPSITGTKVEDTILLGEGDALEVLTPTPGWPMIPVSGPDGQTRLRPDWLIRP